MAHGNADPVTSGQPSARPRPWWLTSAVGPLVVVWIALAAWCALWNQVLVRKPLGSWGYFRGAARLLFSSDRHGGLHLYHYHPEYQFGPVSVVASAPFAWLPKGIDTAVAGIVLTGVGIAVVTIIDATWRRGRDRIDPVAVLIGGLLVLPVWVELSLNNGHVDDVVALLLGVLGLAAVCRCRPVPAALLLALAADAKPWAVGFAVAILVFRGRALYEAVMAYGLGIFALWLPFFVADPQTTAALSFRIKVASDSTLRLFGVTEGLTPAWCRPAQVLIAVLVGLALVAAARAVSGGGPAVSARFDALVGGVLLATTAARIILDPETYRYYTAGAVVAAYVWDRAARRRWPVVTLVTLALLWVPDRVPFLHPGPHNQAILRLAWGLGVLGLLVWSAIRSRRAVAEADGADDPTRPPSDAPRARADSTLP